MGGVGRERRRWEADRQAGTEGRKKSVVNHNTFLKNPLIKNKIPPINVSI